jgi:hypothetical protein
VFDGLVVGNLDAGTMNFDGRLRSGVCAARHEQPPEQSNPASRDCDDPSLQRRHNLCQTSTGKAQN